MINALPRCATAARASILGLVGSATSGIGLVVASSFLSSPWMLVAIPVAAAALVVLLLSPSLAFLLTALVIPVERLGRLTNDDSMLTISLMRIVGSIALLSFLSHAIVRRHRIHFGRAFWVYTLYLCIALTGIFHSSHMLGTVRHCGAILGNLLFFFVVINMGRSPALCQRVVSLWLFATAAAGVYTIATWHFGVDVSETAIAETSARFSTVMADTSEWEHLDTVARATGPTSHSAVYGINLITSLPLYLYFLRHASHPAWKALVVTSIGIVLYNVLLTNTRAVLIVAALSIGLCGLRGLYRVSLRGVIACLLAAGAMLPFLPDAIWSRVLDSSNYSTQTSATLRVRLDYWTTGLGIVNDHWLTGIGVGNQLELPRRLPFSGAEETTAHNEYIFTAMEVGVLGWLVFFSFIAMMLAAAVRAQRILARMQVQWALHPDFFVAIQVAMIATLVFGVQVDVFHFPLKGWWLLAGLAWAQYSVLSAVEREQSPRPVARAKRSMARAA